MGVLWFLPLSGAAPLQIAALELPPSQRLAARRENVTGGWAVREAAAEVYFWFLCWTGSFWDVSRGKIKAYTSPVFQTAANRSCPGEEIFQVLPVALPKVTDRCPVSTCIPCSAQWLYLVSLCRDQVARPGLLEEDWSCAVKALNVFYSKWWLYVHIILKARIFILH